METLKVYDISILIFFFIEFADQKPENFIYRVATNPEGHIGNMLQISPFDDDFFDPALPFEMDSRGEKQKIFKCPEENIWTTATLYNICQIGREWVGNLANENAKELRLILDFSSIIPMPGK